jgi:hypothetical protein
MFPNKLMLDVDDLAKCLNYSRGHIYNLSSAKELPFKLDDHSDKIQISIVAFAKYLDSKLEDVVKPKEVSQPVAVPELIKKRGRPRQGSVARVTMAFQHQLSMAILREEFYSAMNEVEEKLTQIQFPDDERTCSEKFDGAVQDMSYQFKKLKSTITMSFIQISLPLKQANRTVHFKL